MSRKTHGPARWYGQKYRREPRRLVHLLLRNDPLGGQNTCPSWVVHTRYAQKCRNAVGRTKRKPSGLERRSRRCTRVSVMHADTSVRTL
eukprot:3888863-Prymnesium_polylepis.2